MPHGVEVKQENEDTFPPGIVSTSNKVFSILLASLDPVCTPNKSVRGKVATTFS